MSEQTPQDQQAQDQQAQDQQTRPGGPQQRPDHLDADAEHERLDGIGGDIARAKDAAQDVRDDPGLGLGMGEGLGLGDPEDSTRRSDEAGGRDDSDDVGDRPFEPSGDDTRAGEAPSS